MFSELISLLVFVFTSLLFLSGYVLQQQTVRSLQAAIHPHLPSPLPTINPVLAKHFGQPPGFYDKFLASNRPRGGWAKAAYVSLVRTHHDVCAAVMAMRELRDGESMAQRIIMYPREWDEVEGTSRRLLRQAAKDSKVMLQPIDSIQQPKGTSNLTPEERWPLLNMLSLVHYNRVLVLSQPGLILDPTPLDLLFTLPMDKPMLGLSDPQDEGKYPVILLFEPSKDLYHDIAAALPEGAYPDTEFMQRISMESAPEDPEKRLHLLATTSLLGQGEETAFNATEFMDMTAYVHFEDPGLPGPGHDIPRQAFMKAMPETAEARRAWEIVYTKFRDKRMDICGLDLEPV